MEKYRCKVCSRNFISGRALGGHMKSHMMNLYAARKGAFGLKMKGADDSFDSKSSYSSTSDEENEEDSISCLNSVDSVVLRDGESETDSTRKYPSSRRSKRVRRSRTCGFGRMEMEGRFQDKKSKRFEEEIKGKNIASIRCSSYVESEPVSSVLDSTPEEDVAYCLIMLSQDKWERDHKFELCAQILVEEEKRSEDDYSEDFDQQVTGTNKVRRKYKCEACKKLFRSYQALGGHRASHKKTGAETGSSENPGRGSKAVVMEEKVHECPFCPRVFKTGQALGGHKRTHFLGISRNVTETVGPLVMMPFSRIGENMSIDLNLPAH